MKKIKGRLFILIAFIALSAASCTKAPEYLEEVKKTYPQCDIYSQYGAKSMFIGIDTLNHDNVYVIYTGKVFKPDVTSVRKLEKR